MKDFLRSAEEQLKLNKDKETVITELSDHVETKKEFFESIGYDTNASAEKANEAMGSGEIVGQRLNQIHKFNRKTVLIYNLIITAINIALMFTRATDKNSFFIPFTASVIVLVFNFLATAFAIKRKMAGLSAMLIAISCTMMWISMAELAYPLCNLIISRVLFIEDVYNSYFFFRYLITAVIIAIILLPNAFNIYHCRQMRQLRNTKKQNTVAGTLRNFCVIAALFCIIAAFPYYAMNDRLCEEQSAIRDELIDFVFETQNKFTYDEIDELCAYLENCEYDFEKSTRYKDNLTDIFDTAYIYYKGNWQIIFSLENDSVDAYCCADVRCIIKNASEKYLYTTQEKENALIEVLGDVRDLDDEELATIPNSAIGTSSEEIKSAMKDVHTISFSIDKYEVYSVCSYYWLKTDSLYNNSDSFYSNGYQFSFDKENKCNWYSLTIYKKHEPVNWEDYTQ